MNNRDLENNIVDYLTTTLGTTAFVDVGDMNSQQTMTVNNDGGLVLVAYAGSPQFTSPNKRNELGLLVNKDKYIRFKNLVIHIAYHNLRAPGESLYDLEDSVLEALTNYEITGYDPLTPLNIEPPKLINEVWWEKLWFQTATLLEIAVHGDT